MNKLAVMIAFGIKINPFFSSITVSCGYLQN